MTDLAIRVAVATLIWLGMVLARTCTGRPGPTALTRPPHPAYVGTEALKLAG